MASNPYHGIKARRNPFDDGGPPSCADGLRSVQRIASGAATSLFAFSRGPGAKMAINFVSRVAWHLRRNLTRRRLLSFPHFVLLLWVFVLLRGERWIFHWKVEQCKWNKWENWVCMLSVGIPP